jgi:uridine phosphorylase
MAAPRLYHLGFGKDELGPELPRLAFLSGDPDRAALIAREYLSDGTTLSENRGLNAYAARLPSGQRVLSATSGMGAPSLSIVVNELCQLGVKTILRVGTCGAIPSHVAAGNIVISSGALCRQGAADDIAPREYPALADPFVTVALVDSAVELRVGYHLGVTASVDTFYEGQERAETSTNPNLLRALQGVTEEYRRLGILNYEMEAGTLFKMGGVYGFETGCVCGVVAQRAASEEVALDVKDAAVDKAIRVALRAAGKLEQRHAIARD